VADATNEVRLWSVTLASPFGGMPYVEIHRSNPPAVGGSVLSVVPYIARPVEQDEAREERLREAEQKRLPMEVYDIGRCAESDMEDVIYGFGVCENWWFDPYDESVEMTSVRSGWLPDEAQRKAMLDVGIRIAYLTYDDAPAMMVRNETGVVGECSARMTAGSKSALVAKLQHDRDEWKARAEKAEREIERLIDVAHQVTRERDEARALLAAAREVTMSYFAARGWNPGPSIRGTFARIDAALAGSADNPTPDDPTEADRRGEDGAWVERGQA
jgi:hypothetical protein